MPYNVQYVYDTFEVKGEWKFAMSINLLCVFESTVNENTLMSYENYLIHDCMYIITFFTPRETGLGVPWTLQLNSSLMPTPVI